MPNTSWTANHRDSVGAYSTQALCSGSRLVAHHSILRHPGVNVQVYVYMYTHWTSSLFALEGMSSRPPHAS